jgi:DNA-binding MarR family transcriptional regulator
VIRYIIMRSKNVSANLKLADYQALAEFRYQIRRFLRFSEDAARAAGLEPQQHQLLLAVKGMPGGRAARISDLAERLQIQHHSAVELIDRLAARGLVTRNLGEDDRREVYVQLSPRGEHILSGLTVHHKNELRRAVPALVAALHEVGASRYVIDRRRALRGEASPKRKSRSSRPASRASV